MAQVITLNRRSTRNTKGNKGAGRPHHNAIKEPRKPGMFWVDEFTNWLCPDGHAIPYRHAAQIMRDKRLRIGGVQHG